MKAVVLAAGEGTRLRPFTNTRPKVMIPVANRPILEYVVKALVENGVKDIVLVVGYRKERIMSYFGSGEALGASIEYVVQEKQLGTSHALLAAESKLGKEFLVLAGDNIVDRNMVAQLLAHDRGMAVVVATSEMASKYGVVDIKGDQVVNIVEKPTASAESTVSTGVYKFTSDVFPVLEEARVKGVMQITQALVPNLKKLRLRAVHGNGKWMDVVYPWDIIKVNSAAMEWQGLAVQGVVEDNVSFKGQVSVGAGTRIRSGCYIEGPVVIGEGCDIGPYVTIQGATSIGNAVNIGPYTNIVESVIMGGVSLGAQSHLSHCVLDEGVIAGPGLLAACGQANINVEKEFFHLRKIGSLFGQNAALGSGVACEAGTVVGSDSRIADHATIRGNLEDRSIVV
ncbi:MAG TPA: bifunctional sugar-1-phosphate nucleotidylyltransferase/acetyltransferase [Methanomassiliicoccales archaeon]|nr:bifunctional sugar-1-phosphate nucleotidylyltransferase/acetyltransferase [Methanomassiliicoccales archaeon]